MPTLAEYRRAMHQAATLDEASAGQALAADLGISEADRQVIADAAAELIEGCRARTDERSILDLFMQQFGLSNTEGIALMCIAESLLRIPDDATAEELIVDKVAALDWTEHLGGSDSIFVNASTWGLMLTGNIISLGETAQHDAAGWFKSLVGRIGESVARAAMVQAVRILGNEFVLGRDINAALAQEPALASFDMLGEAARTEADAERYLQAYADAIAAVGAATRTTGQGAHGVSVKLSALHPRFEATHRTIVITELFARTRRLAEAAAAAGLQMTLDAEEAATLDLTLDVFELLARDPSLAGWDGLGLAVQAYAKRAPMLIEWLEGLARATDRTFAIRLVKGAYWDTEIKHAQQLGLAEYPIFTRKPTTDVSYLVCAERLLRAAPRLRAQFATHNAHTVMAVRLLGADAEFEFQRLHGMGELLYAEASRRHPDLAPVRVYAPVGRHRDLLAYLVRRLLENGANSSFVNRFLDADRPAIEVAEDPLNRVLRFNQAPHPAIPLPPDLYGSERRNSAGVDLANPLHVEALTKAQTAFAGDVFQSQPVINGVRQSGVARPVRNPADHDEVVGSVIEAGAEHVDAAFAAASSAHRAWSQTPPAERSEVLLAIGDGIEQSRAKLVLVLRREAGKTLADAIDEVREATDFCRYYAALCRKQFEPQTLPGPAGETNVLQLFGRGVFVCISPWNFPLAIFTGQIAAALAAGNAVVAKPAQQTPLTAALVVEIMLEAGLNPGLLALLPGNGDLGAALVTHNVAAGVAFTGGTTTARAINQALAARPGPIVPLIAETGGQNVMLADSSALPEQVVDDVVRSAFSAAGQRCSAIRVLYVQDDIADAVIEMLRGAMAVLVVGDPAQLETDVGPIIDAAARDQLLAHRATLKRPPLAEAPLAVDVARHSFLAPSAYEIDSILELEEEHFGPILHVVRYGAAELDRVLEDIAASGFGLTLGIHSRIERRQQHIVRNSRIGNTYINRNTIGAVVGSQPFGGEGLSGTGPKAGGPLYLSRFATERTLSVNTAATGGNADLLTLPT